VFKIKWEYVITEFIYRRFSKPIARLLARFNVSPNSITLFAAFLGILSGYIIAIGKFYESVILIFISQIFDCVDGDLARLTGRTTKKGAYLDRILDRFVDAALVIGMVAISPEELWLVGMLAIVGSFGVSISRVMAEAEGAECKVGIGGRDTRIVIIMLGLIFNRLYETLVILTALGILTTLHRMVHTLKQLD
jgi:CDP-diacylglycerol--glycerol-3-phosphate 3-phosphatidyltransferase